MSSPSGAFIRVLSYNIHGGVGRHGRFAPDAILAVLQAANADIVGLQEVDHDEGAEADFLHALESLGYPTVLYGPTFRKPAGPYGNVLMTRLPLSAHERIDLSVPGREPRGAIYARLGNAGAEIEVVTTHLGLGWQERREQVDRLALHLQSWHAVPGTALRLGLGDFNDWLPGGRTRRRLHRLFGASPRPATFPARWPLLAIDRIFVQPRPALRCLEPFRAAGATHASDHLPLLATLHRPAPEPREA